MRKYYSLLLMAFFLLSSCIVFAQEEKLTAAVLDLEAREGVSQNVVLMLSDYLRIQLFTTQRFTIVTRENMETILKEQQFQLSGCTSQECIVQVGQLLGVQKMFTGSLGKIGATYLITLKMIDVQSGKLEGVGTEQCPKCEEDALINAIANVANKITGLSEKVIAKPEKKKEKPVEVAPKKEVVPKKEEAPKPKPVPEPTPFDLGCKFGIGLNWPGVQVRYGLNNSLLLEGKAQIGELSIPVGGRLYYIFGKIPGNMPILLYAGGEFCWILSPYLQGGVTTGGFGGLELVLSRNISVGGDAGFYFVDVWSMFGGIGDYGIIFNAGLTYYF